MDINNLLSNTVVQLAILIFAFILIYIILHYFWHVVMNVVRFVLHFFWHGCFTVIAIVILLYILRVLKII